MLNYNYCDIICKLSRGGVIHSSSYYLFLLIPNLDQADSMILMKNSTHIRTLIFSSLKVLKVEAVIDGGTLEHECLQVNDSGGKFKNTKGCHFRIITYFVRGSITV